MKTASPALVTLLNSGEDYVEADCWEITLRGGSIIRWTSHESDISLDGQTYVAGPLVARGAVTEKIGLETQTMPMDITAGDDDLIGSIPVIGFIRARGLDGANVKLRRAFAYSWTTPIVGAVIRFAGRVTSVRDIEGMQASVTVSSWLILLNVNSPPNLFQTGCNWTVYDPNCGLSAAAYTSTSTVAGPTTRTTFGSSLSQANGYFEQGRVTFTSGALLGTIATVKTYLATGALTLVSPLPVAPTAGDTFSIVPGCDLTKPTCGTKFNNLARHRGFPYIPVPEMAR